MLELFSGEENGTAKAAELATTVLGRLNPEIHGLATLELLGNLLQFVPYTEHLAPKLDSRAFRLWVEGLERPTDSALCVPRLTRVGFWNRVIIDAYGCLSFVCALFILTFFFVIFFLVIFFFAIFLFVTFLFVTIFLFVTFLFVTFLFVTFLFVTFLFVTFPFVTFPFVTFFLVCYISVRHSIIDAIEIKLPSNWSAGTLGNLGGFLAALNTAKLNEIPRSSWTEAADVLNAKNGYTRQFMQICTKFLGPDEEYRYSANVMSFSRHLIDASRNLSVTVRAPREIIKLVTPVTTKAPTILHSSGPSGVKFDVLPARDRRFVDSSITHDDVKSADHVTRAIATVAEPNILIPINSPFPTATLMLDEKDLKALLAADEFIECLEFLGSLELSASTTAALWRIIKSVGAVTQLVLDANDAMERLSDELGGALGRLICGLFDKEMQKYAHQLLRPDLLLKISAVLIAALESSPRCPPVACLKGLAEIVSGPMVMGDPATWNYEDVSGLGMIIAGLTPKQIEKLQAKEDYNSVGGLTADSMRCMPLETLNEFSEVQLRSLSVPALYAISPRQLEKMLPSLQAAVLAVRSPPLPEHLIRNVSPLSIHEKESEEANLNFSVNKCSTAYSKMDPRLLMLIVFYAVSIMLNRISF
ncbi:hypothetical protein B566_EDAN010916 [Ephemera danica]|nr:hypothetical protein B566_EDAN010916 [Ephemera danica]